MPVVGRYGERKVQTDALPGVRKTAAETPLSEGAGLAEAQGQQAETFGRIAGQHGAYATEEIVKEKEKADNLVVIEAGNKVARAADEIWTHAQTVKGKDAAALPDTTTHDFNTAADEIANGLTNDRQREAFARIRSQRDLGLATDVHRHLTREVEAYRVNEFKASMDLGVKAIAQHALDPKVRGQDELQQLVDTLHGQASAFGWGPQELADRTSELKSVVHVNAVTALLDDNQTARAKQWFDEAKGDIDVARRASLEKLLNRGSAIADAQQASDAIIAKGGTLTAQLAAAKDLAPDVREHAEQRIKEAHAVAKQAQQESAEQSLRDAYTIVTSGRGIDAIPTSMQEAVATHMPALRSYALSLAKGEPAETDPATYYALKTLSTESREAFLHENLLAHRNTLSKGDFEKLVDLQASMRKGDQEKADHLNAPFLTHKELVETSLTQYGIPIKDTPAHKLTTEEKTTVAQLYRMLDQKTTELQAGGKKATNQDLQSEIDRALMRHVTVTQPRFFGLTTGDVDKRLLGLTIADVTPVEKAALAAALRQRNQPVTDVTMMDLYIANRMRTGR